VRYGLYDDTDHPRKLFKQRFAHDFVIFSSCNVDRLNGAGGQMR